MKKIETPVALPNINDGQPHEVSTNDARWLVKFRADEVFVWSDFGWAKIPKKQMLELLEGERADGNEIMVMKSPHFTSYWFRLR